MNKKWIKLMIIGVFIIMFFSIGHKIKGSKKGLYFDNKILEKIHKDITSGKIEIMKLITFLGSYKFFIVIGLFILFFFVRKKNWVSAFLFLLSISASFGLNLLLKQYYVRIRPIDYFLIEESGYSFPSGHAMFSMTFYTITTYLLNRNLSNNKKSKLLWILNFIIIALIGYSRMYLGVHWPTDIIGGYIAGGLLSYVIVLSDKTIRKSI